MKTLFAKIFIRSLFLQSVWNFERMQNVGFLFAIKPMLDRIYTDKKERNAAYLRHLDFFNTHPYMANIIIPACANVEESNSDIQKKIKDLKFLKIAAASSFAAIGDSFFWGTLRTCAAFISIAVIIFTSFMGEQNHPLNFIIPIVFLFVYNSFHLSMRFWFLIAAFSLKDQNIALINKLQLKAILHLVKLFALLFITASAALYIFYFHNLDEASLFGSPFLDTFCLIVLFALSVLLGRFSPAVKVFSLFLITAALSYLRF